jgi:hypothetical protein
MILPAGIRSVVVAIFGSGNINHRGDDFDFACNNGLIMAGASVLYDGARRSFLQESR